MLALLAAPDSVLWVSLALLAAGYVCWLLGRYCSWGAISMAAALACGVLAILASSHYLLFIWAPELSAGLPGLLLGLPLVYGASLGLLTLQGKRSRLRASLVLASVCATLMLWDGQRLWPAIYFDLKGTVLGYPPLVLHTSEDLGEYVPPAGTRLIFKPTGNELSCGLFANSEPSRPALSYRASCRDYYWGQAMASLDYSAYMDLPRLYALEKLWEEKSPGRLSSGLFHSSLDELTITDLQRLCPQSDDCLASKQMITSLLGVQSWETLTEDEPTATASLPLSLRTLDYIDLKELLRTLDADVRVQLGRRVAGIVAVYADAQARSLALRDMTPDYPRPEYRSWSRSNSAGQWPALRDIADELAIDIPNIGTLSRLQRAVLIAVESRSDGGVRLLYHTAVGLQSTAALLAFIAPLAWLVIVIFMLLRRSPRPVRQRIGDELAGSVS
ncbi:hypothetical protein EKK97_04635 [Billgrantia tianxiuensis]|uniref:Uncharacterized protein n=1 Tax=Billgrantia tianxiuensis TaxID=2497861 RepID=A0A6I6SMG2_9GAMM|nr:MULTISPECIES: hypothetical protein [Halomonas]MCE8033308.1 hypothetical protein [Halomonas sp. MCCC 1A11057]QHC49040.1 hypothetical protein EKK97_04635 [Halomonas tianxiuensis]